VLRWLTLLAVVTTLLAGSLSAVAAQDSATPAAGDGATSSIIYGSDGQPEAEITVHSVVDPYEDFDPSGAPQRGFHYVMADVTITANADKSVETNTYGFYAVDADGFLSQTTYVYRTEDATNALPDFPGGTIEAGQSISGAVFFQALDGTTTSLVLYQPSYDRLITAADLRDSSVAEGDVVEFISNEGAPVATITVEGTESPVEDVDPSNSPQRGFEYVGATVTVENTGSEPFTVDPYSFLVTDTEGFVYNNYSVYRTEEGEANLPSIQSGTEVATGDSVTGLVTFQILAGTNLGTIYFQPSSDRYVLLAEYGDTRAPKPTGTPPASRPNPGTDQQGGDETPAANVTTPGCEGVVDWAETSLPNINAWSESFISVSGALTGDEIDAQTARDAADSIRDLADAQDAIEAPDIAQDANDQLVELFDQSATAIDDLADAIEAGDDAGIAAATADLTTISNSLNDGGEMATIFDELSTACPEIESVE
jgi:hypothetical protein